VKLKASSLGLAVGIGSAILWVICSLVVAVAPGSAGSLTAQLFHVASGNAQVGVTWSGFLVGLCFWSIAAGIFAWLCAALYNRMLPRMES
jgi:hypothetical protein